MQTQRANTFWNSAVKVQAQRVDVVSIAEFEQGFVLRTRRGPKASTLEFN